MGECGWLLDQAVHRVRLDDLVQLLGRERLVLVLEPVGPVEHALRPLLAFGVLVQLEAVLRPAPGELDLVLDPPHEAQRLQLLSPLLALVLVRLGEVRVDVLEDGRELSQELFAVRRFRRWWLLMGFRHAVWVKNVSRPRVCRRARPGTPGPPARWR